MDLLSALPGLQSSDLFHFRNSWTSYNVNSIQYYVLYMCPLADIFVLQLEKNKCEKNPSSSYVILSNLFEREMINDIV